MRWPAALVTKCLAILTKHDKHTNATPTHEAEEHLHLGGCVCSQASPLERGVSHPKVRVGAAGPLCPLLAWRIQATVNFRAMAATWKLILLK